MQVPGVGCGVYDKLPLMVAPANIIPVVAVNIAQADTADMSYRQMRSFRLAARAIGQ